MMRTLCKKRSNPEDYEVSEVVAGEAKKTRYSSGSNRAGQRSQPSDVGDNTPKSIFCANCLEQASRKQASNYNDIDLPEEALGMLKPRFRKTMVCPACAEVLPVLGRMNMEMNGKCEEYYAIWMALLRRDYGDGLPAFGDRMLSEATFRHGCHVAYDLDYRVRALSTYMFLWRAQGTGVVVAIVKNPMVDELSKRGKTVIDQLKVSAVAATNAESVSSSHLMLFAYFSGGNGAKESQATFVSLYIVEHCSALVPSEVLQSAAKALECCGTTDWGAALVINQVLQKHFLRDMSVARTELVARGGKCRVNTTFTSIVFFASPLSRRIR